MKNREAQRVEAASGGRVIHEPELTEEQLRSVPDVAPPLVRHAPGYRAQVPVRQRSAYLGNRRVSRQETTKSCSHCTTHRQAGIPLSPIAGAPEIS